MISMTHIATVYYFILVSVYHAVTILFTARYIYKYNVACMQLSGSSTDIADNSYRPLLKSTLKGTIDGLYIPLHKSPQS